MASNKGLFDDLGIGSVDEKALLQAQRRGIGSDAFQQGQMLGNKAAPLVHGGAKALGGLLTGDDEGRSLGGARQNFTRGFNNHVDRQTAEAGGISVDQLKARREIRKITAQFDDTGDFDARIKVLRKVASVANAHGDFESMAAALRKITEVEKEKEEFAKLEHENTATKRQQDMEKEIGVEAETVDGAKGKAVRINEGVNTGKYLFIEAGEEDRVVRGGDLLIEGVTNPNKLSALDAKRNTVEYWAAKNGAAQGQIGKMRANMNSMAENTEIVSSIAGLLLTANDPQAFLSASGKTAIAADKTISFVESVSGTLADPRLPQTDVRWNGRRTSTTQQRQMFVDKRKEDGYLLGILNGIAGEKGLAEFADLDSFLPPNIRGNALAAEQYWANVMELAYLDARLMEPSNRGLSDNDVKMALKRIGADTANPISFATRQIQVINTKLLPAIENLGGDFQTANDVDTTPEDVSNFVYKPERREAIRTTLLDARDKLQAVIDQGRRGENRAQPPGADDPEAFEPDKTLEELEAELAELEATP